MATRLVWAALWTLIVPANVAHYLTSNGWAFDKALVPALLPYLLGAFTGGLFGRTIAMHIASVRAAPARFAVTAIMTPRFHGLFFHLPQRAYFAQWHAEAFSVTWLHQVVFTGLGSAYLFLVTGLRPLVPWAVIVLAVASFTFSRGRFPASR